MVGGGHFVSGEDREHGGYGTKRGMLARRLRRSGTKAVKDTA